MLQESWIITHILSDRRWFRIWYIYWVIKNCRLQLATKFKRHSNLENKNTNFLPSFFLLLSLQVLEMEYLILHNENRVWKTQNPKVRITFYYKLPKICVAFKLSDSKVTSLSAQRIFFGFRAHFLSDFSKRRINRYLLKKVVNLSHRYLF